MELTFGFGKTELKIDVSQKNLVGTLHATLPIDEAKTDDIVRESLKNPIQSLPLHKIVKANETIAIITSDITRPMPSYSVLPAVLDELAIAGVKDSDIVIVFGLGSHRTQTPEEMRKLVGNKIYDRIKCIDSVGNFIHIGKSSTGTPYDVLDVVVNADRRICMGNIEFHYFAGYSGGAKAIMPGVCTRDAIQANHSKMVEKSAKAGKIEGNPVRNDIDEVTKFITIDFLINVVLDEKKKVRYCVSGHWKKAHRQGCKLLDEMYLCPIKEKADIVLVSQGGYPKDLNLYQTQKALDNAKHAVRDGGIIILIGSCIEGLGEHVFEEWMTGHKQASDMIEHIQQDFQLGGHKAAAIALVLEKARIFLISDMDPDFVRKIHLEPKKNLENALQEAYEILGSDATVLAMPYGGSTLPKVM